MNSLFEVPVHLVMILMLAAAGAGEEEAAAGLAAAAAKANAVRAACSLTEQEWLAAVAAGAGGDGLAGLRSSVFRTSSGRYYIGASKHRESLAGLRRTPALCTRIVFDLARKNGELLARLTGRRASAGDLYIAHVLGAATAAELVRAAAVSPGLTLAKAVPRLAREVPELRPGKTAGSLTAAGLYERLIQAFDRAPPAEIAAAAGIAPSARPAAQPNALLPRTAFAPEVKGAIYAPPSPDSEPAAAAVAWSAETSP